MSRPTYAAGRVLQSLRRTRGCCMAAAAAAACCMLVFTSHTTRWLTVGDCLVVGSVNINRRIPAGRLYHAYLDIDLHAERTVRSRRCCCSGRFQSGLCLNLLRVTDRQTDGHTAAAGRSESRRDERTIGVRRRRQRRRRALETHWYVLCILSTCIRPM